MPESGIERLQRTVERQARELEQLREALRSREVIDVAKGVLVERLGCTHEAAFAELRRLSQETNTKLVRVASALVAHGAERDLMPEQQTGVATGEPLSPRSRLGGATEFHAARAQLAKTLIRSAGTAKQIAQVLCSDEIGAAAVVIMSLDADGGLTMIGQHNLLPAEVTQWRRIPPVMDTYLTRVARDRHPILHSQSDAESDLPMLGAVTGLTGAHAVLPLLVDGRLIGVLELVWRESRTFTQAERHHVASLADYVANSLGSDWEQLAIETLIPYGSSALQTLLDTLLDSAMVLSPIREAEHIADFLIDYVNDATVDIAGRDAAQLVGRRFLDMYPTQAHGLFDALIKVTETGAPYRAEGLELQGVRDGELTAHRVTVRASRFFEGVLVCSRVLDAAGSGHVR